MASRRVGKILHGYYIEKYLSSGSFGDVYKATKRVGGRKLTYALKIFDLSRPGATDDMNDEIKAYRIVSQDPRCQEYIICMYDHFVLAREGGIALEFMGGGDLNSFISRYRRGVPPEKLVILMRDLLTGLAFVHSKGIGHRDIKPGNVLASSGDAVFKVADMGGGCGRALQRCTAWGTLVYLPPELARIIHNAGGSLNQPISVEAAQKGDIWALGLVFWEMAFGKGQFPVDLPGRNQAEIILKLSMIRVQSQVKTPQYSKSAGNVSARTINKILSSMLQVDPNARETAAMLRDFLTDEIKGCSARGRILKRDEIESMAARDSELTTFLRSKGYHTGTNLGTLCSLLREYLSQQDPTEKPPSHVAREPPARVPIRRRVVLRRPIGIARIRAQMLKPEVVTDQEIVNKALQLCKQKGPFSCDKKSLQGTYKLLKGKGGFPRTSIAHRKLQNYYKGKKIQKKLRPCILCLYLSYRKVAMAKGHPDPGLPAEVRLVPFNCFIKRKNIPTAELQDMAQLLGISHQGVSKKTLCEKVYSHLLSEEKISRDMVARDILEGIKISAKDDIKSGITDADPRKFGRQSKEQRQMIDTILDIARLGGSESIDVSYLQTQKDSALRDLKALRDKTDLTRDQKKRVVFLQRVLIYLEIVLGIVGKWSV